MEKTLLVVCVLVLWVILELSHRPFSRTIEDIDLKTRSFKKGILPKTRPTKKIATLEVKYSQIYNGNLYRCAIRL